MKKELAREALLAAARNLSLAEIRFLLAVFDNLEGGWETRPIRMDDLARQMGLLKGSLYIAFAALRAVGAISRKAAAGGRIYTFHHPEFIALIAARRERRERANAA